MNWICTVVTPVQITNTNYKIIFNFGSKTISGRNSRPLNNRSFSNQNCFPAITDTQTCFVLFQELNANNSVRTMLDRYPTVVAPISQYRIFPAPVENYLSA